MRSNIDPQSPVRILYIASTQRSGSTILHNVLSQVDGFFGVGEIHRIWSKGLLENRPCSCGEPIRSCPIWKAIIKLTQDRLPEVIPEDVESWRRQLRERHLLLFPLGFKRYLMKRATPYRHALEVLYGAVREATGCEIVVDSSKNALYGYLLATSPQFDVRVIHLIRDVRDVEASLIRRKYQGHPNFATHSTAIGFLEWSWSNFLIAQLLANTATSYCRVSYEDFIASPRATISKILNSVQWNSSAVPIQGREAQVSEVHGFGGSEERFRTGRIEITSPARTKPKLRGGPRKLLEVGSWPLRAWLKVRYPVDKDNLCAQKGFDEAG